MNIHFWILALEIRQITKAFKNEKMEVRARWRGLLLVYECKAFGDASKA